MTHDTTLPLWALLEARAAAPLTVAAPRREHGLARGDGVDLATFATAIDADRTRAEPLPVPPTLRDDLGLFRLTIPGQAGWALELVARDGAPVDLLGEAASMRPIDEGGANWLLRPRRDAPCAVLLADGAGLLLQLDEADALVLRAVARGASTGERDDDAPATPWVEVGRELAIDAEIADAIDRACAAEAEGLVAHPVDDGASPEANDADHQIDAAWPSICAAALRERHGQAVISVAGAFAALLAGTIVPGQSPARDALVAAPLAERLALRRASQRAATRLRRAIAASADRDGAGEAPTRDQLALRRTALEAVRTCLAAVDGVGALEPWLAQVDAAAGTRWPQATAVQSDAADRADALRRAEAGTAPPSWWLPSREPAP